MDIKTPDSSPASNIWERNYRDCVAKLQINMEIKRNSLKKVIGWMNSDLPEWVREQEHFSRVCCEIRNQMEWK